ncbi:acyl-CoA dehydrogenase family protein [Pannus brasiliensis CCIBt3594]|uniref:Acyl-CoA dehydrogenase family protein n=1 Tax=Pannus brasiliensis CCIBt3594 TaxID=1427578 RepID=A0AAW9QRV3_9CHRO
MPARNFEIRSFLEERADRLNDGTPGVSVGDSLALLGRSGWLGYGIPENLGGSGGSLFDAVEAIAAVSESCLTSGFVFWCQRVFLEYLVASDNPWLQEKVLPRVLSGEIAGATGLSNAMKYLSGIEELRLEAEIDRETVTLNGFLPWASNLDDSGEFVVAVAARAPDGESLVVAVPSVAKGLKRGEDLQLLGLQASRTGTIELDRVQLSRYWIISREAGVFLPKVRPRFLLLQCGLALGIARRALQEAGESLRGAASLSAERHAETRHFLDTLEHLIEDLSWPENLDTRQIRELFELRVAITRLAVRSVWLEAEVKGGNGYFRDSATARRTREVAFLPVLTPSLVQLERELQRQALTDKVVPFDRERPRERGRGE